MFKLVGNECSLVTRLICSQNVYFFTQKVTPRYFFFKWQLLEFDLSIDNWYRPHDCKIMWSELCVLVRVKETSSCDGGTDSNIIHVALSTLYREV